MNTIIVKPNQTLLDVIIMSCGTIECAMDFAAVNGRSISDVVTVGQTLTVPEEIIADKAALKYISDNKIVLGTKS